MYTDPMTDVHPDVHFATITTSIGDEQISFAFANDGTVVFCQIEDEVDIEDVVGEIARALVGIGYSAELVRECIPGSLGERGLR